METKEITQKMETLADELVKWREQADAEIKKTGEASAEVKTSIEKLEAKLNEINVKVERNAIPGGTAPSTHKSIGAQFVESKAYKDMVESGALESAPFEVKDIVATRLTDTSNGVPVIPEYLPGFIEEPKTEMRVAQLFAQAPTTSNSIYFTRATYTRAAAATKESKKSAVVTKPEASLTFTPATETVKTIPVWIPVSRQALTNAPQIQAMINNNLMYDCELKREEEALFGTGVDPHLNGVCTQAAEYDSTLITSLLPEESTPTRIDHLRAAILQARQAKYPVDGIVLNPFDWAAIELTKNTQGNYIWVSVTDGGVTRLWRVNVVESDSMTQGYFLTGAFRLGGTLYNQGNPVIRIGEQHDTYFTQNLIAILCELSCALVITRPQAFVYGAFEEYGS
jgi:HK97 family phage major capsid protein